MKLYDLIVIGSGPAGEKAAHKAAHLNKKVAVIEKEKRLGGAGINTGTLPSKALKQTAVYLSGKYEKGLYSIERKQEKKASINDFLYRKNKLISLQSKVVQQTLKNTHIDLYFGIASFIDNQTIKVKGNETTYIQASHILIATGSYPYHPKHILFDKKRIHDSDSILEIKRFPKSICILGAGVIGCEYATIFATLGIKTYLINKNNHILEFLDSDIKKSLVSEMKHIHIKFILDVNVENIENPKNDSQNLIIHLSNNSKLKVDMFLFAAGRKGSTQYLNLEKVGIKMNKRGLIPVNKNYQTVVPNIFAVGDVIGFPSLANTSMDQGRVAVSHIFGLKDFEKINSLFPYGIYTIPEVSMIGLTEKQAKQKNISYILGRASCPKLPKGQLLGAHYGYLKLIVNKSNDIIIGVHMIGPLATEIIHYGMLLIYHKTTVFDIAGHVFNFPTLHELYKEAAFDVLENKKLSSSSR